MQRQFYQEYDSSEPRLKYGDIFKSSDVYWIHRMMIEGRVSNRSVSDKDLDEKYPYGIPELVAIMSASGGENAQVMWRAIPTWGPGRWISWNLNFPQQPVP